MKNVITISRKLENDGKKINIELAEHLDISHFDSKAIEKLSNHRHVGKGCINIKMNSGIMHYPLSFGKPFYHKLQQGI